MTMRNITVFGLVQLLALGIAILLAQSVSSLTAKLITDGLPVPVSISRAEVFAGYGHFLFLLVFGWVIWAVYLGSRDVRFWSEPRVIFWSGVVLTGVLLFCMGYFGLSAAVPFYALNPIKAG